MVRHAEKPQLRMVWPYERLDDRIEPNTDPGYSIRTYRCGDEAAFLSLMAKTDFDPWDDEKLRHNAARVIPGGWFFAVAEPAGGVVGTAMCLHNYVGDTPFAGDVGWVAVDPEHRGRGLGYSLTAHLTNRFLDAGYTHVRLHTEYHRLPAIRIYLRLGYLPVMYRPEMCDLWREACERIGWAFTPDAWPRDRA